MVKKFQTKIEPLTKKQILERIQDEMSEKNKAVEIRTGDVTEAYFRKELISEEMFEELKKEGFKVSNYQDEHSAFQMVEVSWKHLVNK